MCKYSLEENQLPLDIENYLSFFDEKSKGTCTMFGWFMFAESHFQKIRKPDVPIL